MRFETIKYRYKALIFILYGFQLGEFREYFFEYLKLNFNNIGFNYNTFLIIDCYIVFWFEILLFIVLFKVLNSNKKFENGPYICKKCKRKANLIPCEFCNKKWYEYLENEYKKF